MSAEQNKAIIRRYFEEVWDKGNLAAEEEFVAPDVVVHAPPLPGAAPGVEGAKQVVTMFRTAFPDLKVVIEDLIADSDKVVQRWTAHVTHQGQLLGIPPTGRQVTLTGINIFRFAGGKIVERWGELDTLGILQQLGVVPPPGQASR